MTVNESVVNRIVELVSQELGRQESMNSGAGSRGCLFENVIEAVEAALAARRKSGRGHLWLRERE